jgi:YHS domain-containing protein
MKTIHPIITPARISRRHALASSLTAALALVGFFASPTAMAAQPAINTLKNSSVFSSRTDTAINGYDTVAYFTSNKAVKGLDNLSTDWKGAKWKFSTAANLELFKANPEKYAPQYGGYCAFGVSQGYLVKVDPEQFTVRENKLYLNYDADVQARWSKDITGYISSADQKFPQLLQK